MEDLVLKGYYNVLEYRKQSTFVVEDLVLKGYYNIKSNVLLHPIVVEDLVLKGYYNCNLKMNCFLVLWKTLF